MAIPVDAYETITPPISPSPVDGLIVLTYTTSMEQQPDGGFKQSLSQLSRWAIEAACLVKRNHPDVSMYIAGERTFGADADSTATLMAKHAIENGVPANQVIPITRETSLGLRDTPSQMKAVQRRVANPTGHYMLIGFSTHTERAANHASGYKLDVETAEVEEILMSYPYDGIDPDLDAIGKFDNWQEKIARVLSRVDRKGRILHLISLFQGPRLQDVHIDDQGNQSITNTSARKHIKKLGLKPHLRSRRAR